jgi:hypothetical protein
LHVINWEKRSVRALTLYLVPRVLNYNYDYVHYNYDYVHYNYDYVQYDIQGELVRFERRPFGNLVISKWHRPSGCYTATPQQPSSLETHPGQQENSVTLCPSVQCIQIYACDNGLKISVITLGILHR